MIGSGGGLVAPGRLERLLEPVTDRRGFLPEDVGFDVGDDAPTHVLGELVEEARGALSRVREDDAVPSELAKAPVDR